MESAATEAVSATTASTVSTHPVVSVGIPVYNGVETLERTVRSVLDQSYPHIEVVLSDNASTDGTVALARRLSRDEPRILLLEQSQNRGPRANYLEVLDQASGEYFMWLAADDWIDRTYLEHCVATLESDPTCRLASGRTRFYKSSQGAFEGLSLSLLHELPVDRIQAFYEQVADNSTFYGVMRRDDAAGFWFPDEAGSDWHFVAYLACLGRIRAVHDTFLHRDYSWDEGSHQRIAIEHGQSPFHVTNQYASIAITGFLNLMREGTAYDQLERIDRVSLACYVLLRVAGRHRTNLESLLRQALQHSPQATDQSLLSELRRIRRHLAEAWLEVPAERLESCYRGALGKATRMLCRTGLPGLRPSKADEAFTQALRQTVERETTHDSVRAVLAGQLFGPAHRVGYLVDPERTPTFLIHDLCEYSVAPPLMIYDEAEHEAQRAFLLRFTEHLSQAMQVHRLSLALPALLGEMARTYVHQANFIPTYFNRANLRELFRARARVLQHWLKASGHRLDHDFGPTPSNRRRLRVGVLCAHLNPQTETYSTLPAFEHLDRQRFQVTLYVLQSNGHALEHYARERADGFVQLESSSLHEMVASIRRDDLDVLLIGTNVSAVTNAVTLLAMHRLARVQAMASASPVTTGMPHVDFYISGSVTEPPGTDGHYTEELVLLDGPAHCFNYESDRRPVTQRFERADLGIPDDAPLFASGANFYKIGPRLRETWARIMSRVPESHLLLFPFNPNWSADYPTRLFNDELHRVFGAHDVDASRIHLMTQRVPHRVDVVDMVSAADVYLDSFPFAGVNSTVDPLEAHVPVVLLEGTDFRSRMGSALLRSLELTDLIAESEDGYVERAVRLATELPYRQQIEDHIAERMAQGPRFLDRVWYSQAFGLAIDAMLKHRGLA